MEGTDITISRLRKGDLPLLWVDTIESAEDSIKRPEDGKNDPISSSMFSSLFITHASGIMVSQAFGLRLG